MRHYHLTDHGKRVVSALALGAALVGANLWLAGCGGGSASPLAGGSSGGSRAAISGTVMAPADVSRAARERTRAELVPVAGGTVSLINLDTRQTEASTSTDASGQYSFGTAHADTNYEIRCTKEVSGGTITLSAIVSTDSDTSDATETRALDPDTTVAAEIAKDQAEVIKSVDPNAEIHDLASIAKEMEAKRKEIQAPPPDLTKPEAILSAGAELKQAVTPDGSYAGIAVGAPDGNVRLGALIKGGKFFVLALNEQTIAGGGGGGAGKKARTRSEDPHPSSNGEPGQGNGAETGSGANPGGNGEQEDQGGSTYAVGSISPDGVIFAESSDGVKITGVFVGRVGKGVWKDDEGNSGTWSLSKLSQEFAGLFVGTHSGTNGDGSASQGGVFAALVNDDGTFLLAGGDARALGLRILGSGTVSEGGKLLITFNDGDSGEHSNTATAQIQGNELSGTWSSSDGGQGTWSGSRHEIRSLLN